MAENQAKGAAAAAAAAAALAAAPDGLDARIARRTADCHRLMAEKEQLQLHFVYSKVPKPYYDRWKVEANEIFSMLVGIKHRRRAWTKKAG